MPRYFFHILRGEHVHTDQVGQDLPNREAALKEARLVAGELVRDAAFASRRLDHRLEVTDHLGRVIGRFECPDLEVVPRRMR